MAHSLQTIVEEIGSKSWVNEGKPAIEEADAVLEAAAEWVATLEALVAAKQVSEEAEAEQEAVDLAGTRLVAAVNRWRSGRKRNR